MKRLFQGLMPKDITAEVGVTLQRPAGNFRSSESHVQRRPVPLLQLCSGFGTDLRYLGELCADFVRAPGQLLCPQSPSKGWRSCLFLVQLSGARGLGRKFWQLGTKPVFHRLGESLCISCAFPPRASPRRKEMPCRRVWRKLSAVGWSCLGGRARVSWH